MDKNKSWIRNKFLQCTQNLFLCYSIAYIRLYRALGYVEEPYKNEENEYEDRIDEHFDDLPTYEVIRTVTQRTPDNTYNIFIENDSDKFMSFSVNTPIAQIKQEQVELYTISIEENNKLE